MKQRLDVGLTREEEIALRQIGCQSTTVEPKAAARLVQQALAERFGDGWRLTPLGLNHYKQLPKAPLQGKRVTPIDKILDRVIPLARALAIPQPEHPAEEADTPSAVLLSAQLPPSDTANNLTAELGEASKRLQVQCSNTRRARKAADGP